MNPHSIPIDHVVSRAMNAVRPNDRRLAIQHLGREMAIEGLIRVLDESPHRDSKAQAQEILDGCSFK